MFLTHPPELLREDLPCLADFDFVYRAMKDVSDKLIELQPEKVESFLSYAGPACKFQHPGSAYRWFSKRAIERVYKVPLTNAQWLAVSERNKPIQNI